MILLALAALLKLHVFLKENDSSSFFAKHGGRILTGPTGTNLADVGFVIVRKDD